MKKVTFIITGILCAKFCFSQRIVFDRRHFNAVNENGAMRLGAENSHNNYLGNINQRLQDINLNISSVVLVQNMIRGSLVEVNQALKSGIMARRIVSLTAEIISESEQMLQMARDEPYLLLFAEDVARQMKNRGLNLASEVSAFVLKEGGNVLMDFDKRDLLLKKISLELQVIRALVFSMSRSMHWAKINGLLKSVNPFQGFINQDTYLANSILFQTQLLK